MLVQHEFGVPEYDADTFEDFSRVLDVLDARKNHFIKIYSKFAQNYYIFRNFLIWEQKVSKWQIFPRPAPSKSLYYVITMLHLSVLTKPRAVCVCPSVRTTTATITPLPQGVCRTRKRILKWCCKYVNVCLKSTTSYICPFCLLCRKLFKLFQNCFITFSH